MNRWEIYELLKKEYLESGYLINIPHLLRELREENPYPEEFYAEAMEGYEEFKSMIGHK